MDEDYQLPRTVLLKDWTYQDYEISAAIASWGDALGFVNGENKGGVVVADTVGHVKKSGDRMQKFLDEEISNGWGEEENAKEALINLSNRLSIAKGFDLVDFGNDLINGMIHADEVPTISNLWCDGVSVNYVQLSSDGLTFSNAGDCLGLHVKKDTPEMIAYNGSTLDKAYKKLEKFYQTTILPDETFLIYSDGFINNALSRIQRTNGLLGNPQIEDLSKKVLEIFAEVVRRSKTALETRDNLIKPPYGDLFLPLATPYYRGGDDVTFAVIKRKP
ncbi:MAG: hypothetical protein Q8Q01_04060 [archaeon]|nr:hypothetical protein [archaeon]